MTLVVGSARLFEADNMSGPLVQAAFVCDNCQRMSIGITGHPDYDWEGRYRSLDDFMAGCEVGVWLPFKGYEHPFPDVPEHIAAAASEAFKVQSVDGHRAAILLARAVVEATAKAKDITTGSLAQKIDALFEQGLVRPHIKEAAHEVRYLGNDMAHGDFVTPVSKEEAEEVLGLMAEILDEVFQSPARVTRRRQAREARAVED